jgi:hypothetical protein
VLGAASLTGQVSAQTGVQDRAQLNDQPAPLAWAALCLITVYEYTHTLIWKIPRCLAAEAYPGGQRILWFSNSNPHWAEGIRHARCYTRHPQSILSLTITIGMDPSLSKAKLNSARDDLESVQNLEQTTWCTPVDPYRIVSLSPLGRGERGHQA